MCETGNSSLNAKWSGDEMVDQSQRREDLSVYAQERRTDNGYGILVHPWI